jgi:hypothetical protein
MLRDNLVELIEPMLNSAGANPLALTHHQIQASGDRLPCLENPRPKGAESSLTENVTSPFQAEPAHFVHGVLLLTSRVEASRSPYHNLRLSCPPQGSVCSPISLHIVTSIFIFTSIASKA